MSIMDAYERALVNAAAKTIGDLAEKTAQGLKPMPTGDPICGACKHWNYKNSTKIFGANPPWSFCDRYHIRLHENRKPSNETCFELWEEET